MKFISLFAGIGGFDLGLERAGIQCVGQVEINPFCQRVLAHHWPDVKRIGDIRNVNGTEFGAVDLICGGFPCQPFSCAGKRKGKADDRYLWPEMLRVIQAYRPTWVLGENVAGIVNMALDNVLFDLENEGYETQSFIIPACAVDAPHERKRVWIVAYSDSGRLSEQKICTQQSRRAETFGASKIVAHSESVGRRCGFCQNGSEQNGIKPADGGTDVSNPYGTGFGERRRSESIQQKQRSAQRSGQTVSYTVNDGYNRAQGDASESSSDEPDNGLFERGNTWLPESGICRVAHGIPGRVDRLRSLGNAVVPQVVEVIGRAIIRAHRQNQESEVSNESIQLPT
jgi:DNA (cytosine-5)-methyltransferase 1